MMDPETPELLRLNDAQIEVLAKLIADGLVELVVVAGQECVRATPRGRQLLQLEQHKRGVKH